MTLRAIIQSLAVAPVAVVAVMLAPAAAFAGPDPVCGPHEHVLVERDEEEGSTVKRCVCDEGYQSEAPGKPCKPAQGTAPAKGAPGGSGGKRPGKGGEK